MNSSTGKLLPWSLVALIVATICVTMLPSWLLLGVDHARAALGRLGERRDEAPTVLLHHTPDVMPVASALGLDLVLSGHTHGGQWCLPGFGAIVTASRYWKRYESGHYVERNTHLYVSRGLGLEGFGTPRARFFCPPELALITLSGSEK